jgi:hypothetical protein
LKDHSKPTPMPAANMSENANLVVKISVAILVFVFESYHGVLQVGIIESIR